MQKTFLLILLIFGFLCRAQPIISEPEIPPSIQVIVVGAGISGLAAAKELQDDGYRVVVLEARDRIGGRIWTQRDASGLTLDMGASWIHGLRDNPLTDIARQLDLPLVQTDYENYQILDFQRESVGEDERDLDRLGARLYRILDDSRKESVSTGLRSRSKAIPKISYSQAEVDFVVNTWIEHEFAADAEDLSIEALEEGKDFGGADALFPDGYDQIIDYLAEGLEIRLEHVVTKVDYRTRNLKVTTKSGEVFSADAVLLTVPLGVLQNKRIEFLPSLPAKKQAAIQSLGMGLLNKLYLKFPNVFWEEDIEVMGYVSEIKGQWGEWYNLRGSTQKPILLGFVAGSYAEKMEKLTDQEIVKDAMGVLRKMYGGDIPEPTEYRVTRWRADPFADGSYSYLKFGAETSDRRILGAPVDDKLFFAGEATDPDYPATVHGALFSGLREAKRIHKQIRESR